MRHIGRVFVCKGYLAGNREAVSFRAGRGGREAGLRGGVAGDYAFTGGWKERGRVRVNRLSDGSGGRASSSPARRSATWKRPAGSTS